MQFDFDIYCQIILQKDFTNLYFCQDFIRGLISSHPTQHWVLPNYLILANQIGEMAFFKKKHISLIVMEKLL